MAVYYNYESYRAQYTECETDLEFYNFLACEEGYGEEQVKEIMQNITGGDDAYYNAMEQAEDR